MFKFLAIVAALVATVAAIDLTYNDCSAGQPSFEYVRVPECSAVPCGLGQGDTITVKIGVQLPNAVTRLPVRAFIVTANGEEAYDLPTGDACYAVQGGCPLSAGAHEVSFPVTINDAIPSNVETVIRVELDDDAGNSVGCGAVTTTFG